MRNYILLTVILCGILSCNKQQKNSEAKTLNEPLPAKTIISSAAKVLNNTERKFVRTADIKCKVNDVATATYAIESTCATHGGFVTYTNLISNVDDNSETPISKDSMLQTTHFTVTNTITLSVPNDKLDTTLQDIAKNIDYLDYRVIKADDVSLQMMANSLTQTRATNNSERLAKDIDNNNKQIDKTIVAEEEVLSKQAQADNAKMENLGLNEKVKFSTVNLLIYQGQGVKRSVVLNEKNAERYSIGNGYKLRESISYGWNVLLVIFLAISKLWSLLLLAWVIFALYKWYIKKV
jgi:Domain of unknown function (DUF4349)